MVYDPVYDAKWPSLPQAVGVVIGITALGAFVGLAHHTINKIEAYNNKKYLEMLPGLIEAF
jgi:hypothetical protein